MQKDARKFYRLSLEHIWEEVVFEGLKKGDLFAHSEEPTKTFEADGDYEPEDIIRDLPARIKSHQVLVHIGEGLH